MTVSDRYRHLSTLFDDTISAVSDWERPSPCEEWTARDVLEHVLSSEIDVPTKVDVAVTRTIDVGTDPIDAWHEVRDGMQAILDDPARAGLEYESLGATTTLAATVDSFLCFDLIVHRWDIGRATGVDVELEAADIADANAFLDTMGQMFYKYGASLPAIPVPEDASDQDKLLGRAGRDPRWSAS